MCPGERQCGRTEGRLTKEVTERDLQNPGQDVFLGTQGTVPSILNLPTGSPFLNDNEHVLSMGHCFK